MKDSRRAAAAEAGLMIQEKETEKRKRVAEATLLLNRA
jgi:hypothetical protein